MIIQIRNAQKILINYGKYRKVQESQLWTTDERKPGRKKKSKPFSSVTIRSLRQRGALFLFIRIQDFLMLGVCIKKQQTGASLVAQWLRILLPRQGTLVRALVQEDPTCHGATKPVCHNYWACALEPVSHNYWAHKPQLLKLVRLEPVLHNKRSHCNEKPVHHNEEQPPLTTTRESPHAATKTQRSQEYINKLKKKKKEATDCNL